MKRWQKRLLLALGIVDLVVVGILGFVTWKMQQPEPIPEPYLAPCANLLLERLPAHLSPAVSWTADRLDVRLTAWYDVPNPPSGSAQLLWMTLDALSETTSAGCPPPPEVILAITARGTEATFGHIVELRGDDVAAWEAGLIEEEMLVERGRYRLSLPTEALPAPTPYPQ